MGLSGSGKSTLVRLANRLHEPTAGHVFVDGEDICSVHSAPAADPPASKKRMQEIRRTKMAMVFQHFALFPHMTVAENAAYGLKVQGVDEAQRRERALAVLEQVGLGSWADHFPRELSGGMQQRVGLARALATGPDVLLMDEAFSALDPLIRRKMQDELLELQARVRKTILFVTHDINEALRLGNRVAIMRDGRIVQVGTPTEIVTRPGDDYVADFMADVDQAKVVEAGYVMSSARPLVLGETTLVAARNAAAREGAYYIVDREGHPVGLEPVRFRPRTRPRPQATGAPAPCALQGPAGRSSRPIPPVRRSPWTPGPPGGCRCRAAGPAGLAGTPARRPRRRRPCRRPAGGGGGERPPSPRRRAGPGRLGASRSGEAEGTTSRGSRWSVPPGPWTPGVPARAR